MVEVEVAVMLEVAEAAVTTEQGTLPDVGITGAERHKSASPSGMLFWESLRVPRDSDARLALESEHNLARQLGPQYLGRVCARF
jgi:hypothetical protein